MTKFNKVAVATAVGLVAVGVSSVPAQAESAWQCTENGHVLTTTVFYTTGTTNHTWGYLTYKLSGSGTGGKSNWSASFNDGSGQRNYYADNQNDLDNGVLYTEQFTNFTSPKSRAEKWNASAVFDTSGTDNRCSSGITL